MATSPIVPSSTLAPPVNKAATNPTGGAVPQSVPGATPLATPVQLAQQNPYAPAPGGAPGFTPTSIVPGIGTTATGGLEETYGKGLGGAIGSVIGNLGTATDSAVSATNAAAEITGKEGFDSLRAQQANAGISPNSSVSALAGSEYWNNFDTNLTSTDSNMELSEENELLNVLQTAGEAHGPDESGFSKFMDVAGPVLTAAGGIAADVATGGAAIPFTASSTAGAVSDLGSQT